MKSELPANYRLEQLCLGYALMNQSHLDAMRGVLAEEDFTTEAHRIIWRLVCEMYDQGKPVDKITVIQELKAKGQDQTVGGLSYLVSLDDGLPDFPQVDG